MPSSRAFAALLFVAACRPAGYGPPPTDVPPLPPLSSSSIGLLIDQQDALHLQVAQVQRLQALDHQLTVRNEPLELELRESERPAHAEAAPDGDGGGRHGRHGGGGHRHGAAAAASPTDPDGARRVQESIDANDRSALAEAMQVLDDQQRASATAMLAQHH